jgi:multidrug efflux pump subunit AcrB
LSSLSEGSFLNCVIVTSRLSKNALHGSHPSRGSSSFSHSESSEIFRAAVLVFIYILVVGWFKSFKTPLVIMAPIPLTLVGILPAHAAMGAFFTATYMIGFIVGTGIIFRNSIILVKFI